MAKALKPGVSPCSLTYMSLARSSRSMTGRGRRICRHEPGPGVEEVALGPDRGRQGGHQLLADGVEGRVGHLGEELGEVVVEQAGTVREDGDGGVRAHGAQRLAPGAGHRGQDDPQLLGGVAEQALLAHHPAVLGREHGAGGQLIEPDLVVGQPLGRRGARRPTPP